MHEEMTMAEEPEAWSVVRSVFSELFEVDPTSVDRDTTAADVEGWDSVTHIELLVELERRLSVRFRTGEMAGLTNVGDLVDLIAAKRGSA